MSRRIENPIINAPYVCPTRHFRFDDDGITDELVDGRRRSEHFVPIPPPRRQRGVGQQELSLSEQSATEIRPNDFTNHLRDRVDVWRRRGWPGVTGTTRRLLEYWTDPSRERRLFFCQVEALETAIFLGECAERHGEAHFLNDLRRFNDDSNPGLFRVAHKMATGTGKTVVMAMLIAWHTLNKSTNPMSRLHSDAFLVVCPGITIRDRLRVLLPSDPGNYYRERDLVPPELRSKLARAQIEIVNFHVFKLRETLKAPKATRQILGPATDSIGMFTETPDQMVRRAVGSLARKRNVVVLNDEAHHCYRRKPDTVNDGLAKELKTLKGEDRVEAEQRDRDARVWLSGLEAVTNKVGVRAVYDLSATPFFLRGSGYAEGSLFPWVVSDFGLIDAIEAGLVKIPRVPVDDDTLQPNDLPTYRTLWLRIRDKLPRKGDRIDEPSLPVELEGALLSLYGNYERSFQAWHEASGDDTDATPPVFIVVCNNTTVSKMVFDWIAGHTRTVPGQPAAVAVSGHLELFSNVIGGQWTPRPATILVDSHQLESDDAMTEEFKRVAAAEIDLFKREYRARFPGRDAEDLSDSDLLREVMNTVGKPGRLGEHVRCVVSVSMLTEGWDANSVTHVLGVRAFGTQLLCEQVVGRGLRRMNYVADPGTGHFLPEYAEVYGIPFTFMPASDVPKEHQYRRSTTGKRVWAQPDRAHCRITFPRVVGYRYEIGDEHLSADFDAESRLVLSNADLPTYTEVEGITGAQEVHTLDDLRSFRKSSVAFSLTEELVLRFRDDPDENGVRGIRPWLFPRLNAIVRQWMNDPAQLVLTDGVFPQLLMIGALREQAVERIYNAIVATPGPEPRLSAILRDVDPLGSTDEIDFYTAKPLWATKTGEAAKCPVNAVTLDSRWEQTVAQRLEQAPAVRAYVKNQGMGFEIPYAIEGKQHKYVPDFVARVDDGNGLDDLLNVLIEVSGLRMRPKETKVDTARDLWCPAVTNLRAFGRWKLVEITDPANVIPTLAALAPRR